MKKIQYIPAVVTFLAIGFSYYSQWCIGIGQICYRTVIDQLIPQLTYPLYFFSLYFFPVALVLILVPQQIFNSWLKLAAWATPISIIFIALTPVNFTGLGIDFFPFYRDDAARLAGQVFAVISVLLIAWKYFSTRSQST